MNLSTKLITYRIRRDIPNVSQTLESILKKWSIKIAFISVFTQSTHHLIDGKFNCFWKMHKCIIFCISSKWRERHISLLTFKKYSSIFNKSERIYCELTPVRRVSITPAHPAFFGITIFVLIQNIQWITHYFNSIWFSYKFLFTLYSNIFVTQQELLLNFHLLQFCFWRISTVMTAIKSNMLKIDNRSPIDLHLRQQRLDAFYIRYILMSIDLHIVLYIFMTSIVLNVIWILLLLKLLPIIRLI